MDALHFCQLWKQFHTIPEKWEYFLPYTVHAHAYWHTDTTTWEILGNPHRMQQPKSEMRVRPSVRVHSFRSPLLPSSAVQITHRKALKMSRVSEEWQNKKQKPLLALSLSFLDAISGAVADVGTDHGRSGAELTPKLDALPLNSLFLTSVLPHSEAPSISHGCIASLRPRPRPRPTVEERGWP